jgi:mortality factor 4-like protein 1
VIRYFVHYQGWNKSWDEWVPENRVLKFNDANIEKQKELRDSHDAHKAKKKKRAMDNESVPSPSSGTTKSTRSSAAAGKEDGSKRKMKLEPNVEGETEFMKKMEIKIKLPDELKNWLIDDWELINKQKKLVEIPSRTTVQQILDEYVKSKKGSKVKESQVQEVTAGIREYFDAMIGCQLLYKFEKPQYNKIVKESPEDAAMSSVYGAIHLVRLFVRLGQMLVYSDLDEKDITVLMAHIQDFLKYMARSSYFSVDDYHVAPPEYLRKTM